MRENNGATAVLCLHNFSLQQLSDVQFHASSSNLSEGTYNITDLLANTSLGTISVDSNGGFSDYKPFTTLEGKESKFIKLSQ